MTVIDECSRQLKDLKSATENADSAYLVRSRLGRLARSLTATFLHVGDEDFKVNGLSGLEREQQEALKHAIGRLDESARIMSQPSEPLDQRWRNMWEEFRQDICFVEKVLEDYQVRPDNSD